MFFSDDTKVTTLIDRCDSVKLIYISIFHHKQIHVLVFKHIVELY